MRCTNLCFEVEAAFTICWCGQVPLHLCVRFSPNARVAHGLATFRTAEAVCFLTFVHDLSMLHFILACACTGSDRTPSTPANHARLREMDADRGSASEAEPGSNGRRTHTTASAASVAETDRDSELPAGDFYAALDKDEESV